MTGRLITLAPKVVDKSDALDVIDSLRAAIESGQIKAFACVGIEPDHNTRMWSSSTAMTSRLEMIGAMTHLLHCYEADAS